MNTCESKMPLLNHETISLALHDILNDMGYNEKNIRERIYYGNRSSLARTLSARTIQNRDDIDRIFVGSIREGIGYSYISDMDVLQIYKSVSCVETIDSPMNGKNVVFLIENHDTPPGYVNLKLVEKSCKKMKIFEFDYALSEHKRQLYLSSEKFMSKNDDMFARSDGYIAERTYYNGRKGPSFEKVVKNGWFKKYCLKAAGLPEETTIDYVRGFPCFSKNILKAWKNRTRSHGWPCKSVLKDVLKLPAVLVPVGQHGSKNEDLQWRICFPYGELRLIHSLSYCHVQVLVLLKLVAKHILLPICEGMTTYVMKNVMFWMAEETPEDQFRPDAILDRLLDALISLRDCINKETLPYYIIQERNLLSGKINKNSQSALVSILTQLIEGAPLLIEENILSECPGRFSDRVKTVLKMHFCAFQMNRAEILVCESITTEKLTEYYVKLFDSQSFFQAEMADKKMLKLPAIWKGRKKLFFDPLSIEFPLKEAEASLEPTLRQHLMGTLPDDDRINTEEDENCNNSEEARNETNKSIEPCKYNNTCKNGAEFVDPEIHDLNQAKQTKTIFLKDESKRQSKPGSNSKKSCKRDQLHSEKRAPSSPKHAMKNKPKTKKNKGNNRWKKGRHSQSACQSEQNDNEKLLAFQVVNKERREQLDMAFVNLFMNFLLLLYKCQDFSIILTNPLVNMMQVPIVIVGLVLMIIQSFDSIGIITDNCFTTMPVELIDIRPRRQTPKPKWKQIRKSRGRSDR